MSSESAINQLAQNVILLKDQINPLQRQIGNVIEATNLKFRAQLDLIHKLERRVIEVEGRLDDLELLREDLE